MWKCTSHPCPAETDKSNSICTDKRHTPSYCDVIREALQVLGELQPGMGGDRGYRRGEASTEIRSDGMLSAQRDKSDRYL
jgi:hypothetical protein